MIKLADLLQADPFDTGRIEAKLEELGLVNPVEAAPVTAVRRTASRAASRMPRRTRIAVPTLPTVTAPTTSTSRAEKLIDGLAKTPSERAALLLVLDELLDDISRAADPFRSLLNFSRVCDANGDRVAFFHELHQRPAVRARLARLLSWSQALSETLVREPELLDLLRTPPQPRSRGELRVRVREQLLGCATDAARFDALRRFRRRETLRIGLLDMERQTWRSEADFELVVRQISDLAQVCVQCALKVLCGDEAPPFAVLAMGKLGARELNYSSDIDLIFLHDGESAEMDRLGQSLLRELGASTIEGQLFRVDMRLRPEGSAGPLVSGIGYALSYYESYAAPWEWQALIKTRAIAGDAKLARRFRKFTRGITWARRTDDDHLRSIIEMKRRSESTTEGADANNVKQGPGGIRDAEWIIQQLQMMVGPQHPRARAKDSLQALEVLRSFDALSYPQAAALRDGYLFLRVLEHRLQLWEERAIRNVPESVFERAALARRMGCTWRGESAVRWLDEEHRRHRSDIRALCERLFWGWRDEERMKYEGGGMKDSEAIQETDSPDSSDFHLLPSGHPSFILQPSAESAQRLKRLSEGSPTRPFPAPLSRQIRAALPKALEPIEFASQPERALLNLERLCDASGNRLSLLRSLADAPHLSRAVFAILGGSQTLSDTLVRFPELLDMAAQRPLLERAKSWDEARSDCRSYCLTFRDREAALRRWKRREVLRIGLRDLILDASPIEITRELSDLCRACLSLAVEEAGNALLPASSRIGFAILGMGKLGGGEMHYGSDADVLFAYETRGEFEGAGSLATRWANDLIQYLGAPSEEGTVFEVDARLRPDGRNGAMAPSIDGYLKYFERASGGIAVWERQALTRARLAAGDAQTGAKLLAAIRHVSFPEIWQSEWSDELRHIKARVENERAAKSTFSTIYDVKLGRGGLSDIEWSAQWLAMRYGAAHPDLQTPNTLRQIEAARAAKVLSDDEARVLTDGYVFLRRAELRLQITQEHAPTSVKENASEWKSWARSIFPDVDEATACERFAAEWLDHTQAVRKVMERVRDSL